ncbi:MAG: hypothetical protein ABL962_15840, partial [Fimbriimonadaceae bacterium]
HIVIYLSFKNDELDQLGDVSHLKDPALVVPSSYGYVRASSRKTPVWKWVEERFRPRFPHLDVLVSGSGDSWLNASSFLSEAEEPTRSLNGEKIIVTINADRRLPGLHSLSTRIVQKWGLRGVTTKNTDEEYFFGLFSKHALEIKIPRLRMYSWTASRMKQAFEKMAQQSDSIDVEYSDEWGSDGDNCFGPLDLCDLEQMIEAFRP